MPWTYFKIPPKCPVNTSKFPQTPPIYPRGPKTPKNGQDTPNIKCGRKCRLAKLSSLGGIRAINIKFCLLQKYPFMSIYYSIEVLNMWFMRFSWGKIFILTDFLRVNNMTFRNFWLTPHSFSSRFLLTLLILYWLSTEILLV